MGKVTVRILGPLSQIIGKKVMEVEAETLEDLNKIEQLKDALYEGNELKSSVRIYINGKDLRFIKGEVRLNEGDEIMILSAVGGG
jgi:molybdopterin converting factor small subunit